MELWASSLVLRGRSLSRFEMNRLEQGRSSVKTTRRGTLPHDLVVSGRVLWPRALSIPPPHLESPHGYCRPLAQPSSLTPRRLVRDRAAPDDVCSAVSVNQEPAKPAQYHAVSTKPAFLRRQASQAFSPAPQSAQACPVLSPPLSPAKRRVKNEWGRVCLPSPQPGRCRSPRSLVLAAVSDRGCLPINCPTDGAEQASVFRKGQPPMGFPFRAEGAKQADVTRPQK